MAVSKIRQNYHEDCEALINKQINMEFYASYVYLSMVCALPLNSYNLAHDFIVSYQCELQFISACKRTLGYS